MMLFRNKYRIESARLTGWDYSTSGYYFVTVCTHDRGNLFGKIVYEEWVKLFEIRRKLVQDEFVVMPKHFHGIVRLVKIVDQFNVDVDVNVNVNRCRDVRPDVSTGTGTGTGTHHANTPQINIIIYGRIKIRHYQTD